MKKRKKRKKGCFIFEFCIVEQEKESIYILKHKFSALFSILIQKQDILNKTKPKTKKHKKQKRIFRCCKKRKTKYI